jgi:hypothetical protein
MTRGRKKGAFRGTMNTELQNELSSLLSVFVRGSTAFHAGNEEKTFIELEEVEAEGVKTALHRVVAELKKQATILGMMFQDPLDINVEDMQSYITNLKGLVEHLNTTGLLLCSCSRVASTKISPSIQNLYKVEIDLVKYVRTYTPGVSNVPAQVGIVWSQCDALTAMPLSTADFFRASLKASIKLMKDALRELLDSIVNPASNGIEGGEMLAQSQSELENVSMDPLEEVDVEACSLWKHLIQAMLDVFLAVDKEKAPPLSLSSSSFVLLLEGDIPGRTAALVDETVGECWEGGVAESTLHQWNELIPIIEREFEGIDAMAAVRTAWMTLAPSADCPKH